ncbi:rCG24857 [Rattus norvegicus]|uniref:RCG24857 n=1 Tax=Rattus norvegicus TaxID=10116 RepID=A6JCF0_RAT|nr:rCG24857 [Rattus norvegicus]
MCSGLKSLLSRTQVLGPCGSCNVLEHRSSAPKEDAGRLPERIRLEQLSGLLFWQLAHSSVL